MHSPQGRHVLLTLEGCRKDPWEEVYEALAEGPAHDEH